MAFGGPAGPNPYASPDGGPPLKPVGSTRGGGLSDVSSAAKWLAGLLAGLIGAGAIWWFTRGPDVTLPDQIAGVQKVENPGFEAFADTLADQINTSGSGASYGIGTDVDFAVMAFAGHDDVPPDQRMYDVAAAPVSGVTVNASETKSFRARDSDFACAPFAGVVRGMVCLWRDGDTMGIVYDYNVRKLRPARQLSVGVYEAVRL